MKRAYAPITFNTHLPTCTFAWDGITWDVSPAGQAQILESAFRASLYGARPQTEPAILRAATGETYYLSAGQALGLALALLDWLNEQRAPIKPR